MAARVDLRGAAVTEVAALAAEHAGMQASMLDRRQVRQAMETRMKVQRVTEADDYVALCRVSEAERQAVVELTANGETSFLRDARVFEELTAWCVARMQAQGKPLRILSAPCSTGEEPYSVAASLLAAGFAAEQFVVEAVDISAKALARAEQGVYGAMSLRGVSAEQRKSFLDHGVGGWRVKDDVRRPVRFRQGNLVEPGVLREASYDLILSRNLLLYQSTAARMSVAASLAAALVPDGRLVFGSADWGSDLEPWFALEQPVRSLAAVHRPHEEAVAEVAPVQPALLQRTSPPARTVLTHAAEEEIARTADLYRHALEAHIQKHEAVAEQLCRQALYLDPEHLPSLELLAELHRPHVTQRMRTALTARLARKRRAGEERAR